MGIKVHNRFLSHYMNDQSIAEASGDTIGECLKHLEKQFPKLKLFDKYGNLLDYIGVFVNGEIAYPKELDKPVKDGDELYIILMAEGG